MRSTREHPSDRVVGGPEPRTGRIVVGVDSTTASTEAVRWAAAEAANRRRPLHIMHTWTWPHLAPWLTTTDRVRRNDLQVSGENLVKQCRIVARDAGAPEVSSEVREGNAGQILLDESRLAALLFVGTHHVGLLGRTVLGSTSAAVVAESVCPVVVVSPAARPGARPTGVVVGIAAAPQDESALGFGFGFAQRHNLPLEAVYCCESANVSREAGQIPAVDSAAWLAESIAGWREAFPEVPVQTTVRAVHPVSGLVSAAGTDRLLVVGRRAPHRHRAGRVGSVSLGVLHHAACSIAVVPA